MPAGVVPECTLETCSLDLAFINYDPSLAGNAIYLSLFGVILIIQAIQGIYYRTWSFTGSMLSGLVLEVMGYVGRVQMHFNPFVQNSFLIYLICLAIGPVFFSAAIYLCLSRIIVHYGSQHARIPPKAISIGFMTCDWIALILQSVGGALADTASTAYGQEQGTHIMVSGLGFQVLTLLIFVGIAAEFLWNSTRDSGQSRIHNRRGPPNSISRDKAVDGGNADNGRGLRMFLSGLAAATLLILVRSSFRVAELAKGFGSKIANEEVPFMVLEGAMIVLATAVLSVCHPGMVFGAKWPDAGWN